MPELRYDLVKKTWVSVAGDRALRPNDFPLARKNLEAAVSLFCPFCEGNEQYTPPELAVRRNAPGEPNTPGWDLRVIPNKYAAFELTGEFVEQRNGMYRSCTGLGTHEVVVESAQHDLEFHQFDRARIHMLIKVLVERYRVLAQDPRIRYIQIYKNRGMVAGASLEHSHSQIVALPLVTRENQGMPDYYEANGRCLLCDMMEQEFKRPERLIFEGEHFIIMCPFAPRFPYESWIVPRDHAENFGDMTPGEMEELSSLLYHYSRAVIDGLSNPAFNYVVNTAPVNSGPTPGYHWYWEIVPRLLIESAVEVASGIHMNPVAPELAAPMLREALLAAMNAGV
ncbi:MAG: DUF4931 domain-containing protein [Syntrophomonadaceae bacterium]|nr:DUF4931 domain-containing protein [Syntrophomonadaceae bacterium]